MIRWMFHSISPKRQGGSRQVTRWRYRTEGDVEHIGPMAQDFHEAFGVGPDEWSIATVDADGVALAAIQGLNAKVDAQAAALVERDARITALESQLAALRANQRGELAELRSMLETLLAARNAPELVLVRR